jgi:hypothetical protein
VAADEAAAVVGADSKAKGSLAAADGDWKLLRLPAELEAGATFALLRRESVVALALVFSDVVSYAPTISAMSRMAVVRSDQRLKGIPSMVNWYVSASASLLLVSMRKMYPLDVQPWLKSPMVMAVIVVMRLPSSKISFLPDTREWLMLTSWSWSPGFVQPKTHLSFFLEAVFKDNGEWGNWVS